MKFDEYIRNNRQKFDVEKPDEDYLWTGISQSLNNKKKRNSYLILKIAAAIFIAIGLSFITYQMIAIRLNQELILANIDPKLAKEEAELQNQIKVYYQVLENSDYNKDLLSENFKDLEYMDTLILQYSKDLNQNGPNPRLLNSLMDLYQKKIRLLDRMLNEIEKDRKNESNKTNI
jgi:hypothetical protein